MSTLLSGKSQEIAVRPSRTLKAKPGWQALNVRELWQFRDLLVTLAGRDVKLRYRQTAVGVLWVVLQPLLAAGIFAFVFGKVANLPAPKGVPYFVFSYAGLLGWNVFSGTVVKVSASLVQNANLISKVYFPRLILPLSMMFSTLIDFAVSLALLPVLMLIAHVVPGLSLLTLPLWFALILMLALGVGMFAAALAVTYRDVQYVIPVLMQFFLYASPVAYMLSYALTKIPPAFRTFYYLNPMAGLLEAFRWSLLGHETLPVIPVAYAAVVSLLAFFAGAYAFKKMERKFADVI
ncbi:MAG: ABC transporter permease [Janthinobacterium lividum]